MALVKHTLEIICDSSEEVAIVQGLLEPQRNLDPSMASILTDDMTVTVRYTDQNVVVMEALIQEQVLGKIWRKQP